MKKPAGHNLKTLKEICTRLVIKHPEAVAMAAIELDCGCVNVCGVSYKGEPAGTIKSIPAHQESEDDNRLVCFTCLEKKNEIDSRIVNRGLIWPGDDDEMPAEEVRLLIGREVFGPDYSE